MRAKGAAGWRRKVGTREARAWREPRPRRDISACDLPKLLSGSLLSAWQQTV